MSSPSPATDTSDPVSPCSAAAASGRPSATGAPLESTVDLLLRARGGDQHAWDALIRRHLRPLRRIAHQRLPSTVRGMADTDDLVQDALVRALRHVHQRDFGHRGALLAYLRRAVINRVLDELRRSTRAPAILALTGDFAQRGPSPLDRIVGREQALRYRRAIARLKPRDRRVIALRMEAGLPYQDIAVRLGMSSADAARVAANRALWRLARHFAEE